MGSGSLPAWAVGSVTSACPPAGLPKRSLRTGAMSANGRGVSSSLWVVSRQGEEPEDDTGVGIAGRPLTAGAAVPPPVRAPADAMRCK